MRIPSRFSAIVFGALLSAIMVAVVSAVVLAVNQGIQHGFRRRAATGTGVCAVVKRRVAVASRGRARGSPR